MAAIQNPAVPKGAWVLVTGASGLLGSNIVNQFLEYGYKVRGTTRNLEKTAYFTELFETKHGKGTFEMVEVPDMTADGAYDVAIKGVSAIVHTASVMTLDPDPNNVIPQVIAGATNALKAAFADAEVKRFVYTSSSSAVVTATTGVPGVLITEQSWNEEVVKKAWAPPPFGPKQGLWVYGASKVQGEQAIWKYYNENRQQRPDLVVNTVLSNLNIGKTLDHKNIGYPSSSYCPVGLWKGDMPPVLRGLSPQYYIDAGDTGRLHVAGAIHPDVKGERIFGFAGHVSWDAILDIYRRNFPEKTFMENLSGGTDPTVIKQQGRAEQLLRDLGREGWVSLEESVLRNIEDVKDAE